MLIRRYKGKNLRDALRKVKAELGESATILNTRTVRSGLFGSELEVSATLAPESGPPSAAISNYPGVSTDGARPNARESLAQVNARRGYGSAKSSSAVAHEPLTAPPQALDVRHVANFLSPLRNEIRAIHTELKAMASESRKSDDVEQRIDKLCTMLQVMQQSDACAPAAQPRAEQALGQLLDRLLNSGMRRTVAKSVCDAVRAKLPPGDDAALRTLELLAAQVIAETTRRLPPLEPKGGGSQVVALVGPPGVGKTTTLAKIATRAALLHGRSVAIIGCDTGRIGATQALQSVAELLDVPCRIAKDAVHLSHELALLAGRDLVLVDTGGCSGRDVRGIEALSALFAGSPVKVLVLLNADMRALELDANLAGFATLKPHALVMTKIDQAVALGALLDATSLSNVPVLYLTNGRRIPDDIEDATPERIASHVLGFQFN